MRQPSDQLQGSARQVRQLIDTAARLCTRNGDHDVGHTQRPWQQHGRGPSVCWRCRERGNLGRNCHHCVTRREQPCVSDGQCVKGMLSLATNTALSISGWIEQCETQMLFDTGVTIF